jgi:hypothetical protein
MTKERRSLCRCGDGLGAEGLKQNWLIDKSLKRDFGKLPLGRQQIGKFGYRKTYEVRLRQPSDPHPQERQQILFDFDELHDG